jgi:hypothetical protein
MPTEAFLMTGAATPFRQAEPCPVLDGPHGRSPEDGSYLVADATTRDGSAAVRIAVWRCSYCGVLVTGIGRLTGNLSLTGSRENRMLIDSQEFTWLEETPREQ